MFRGAIVGFGQVALHGHLPGYARSTDAKIVAVVDRAKERRDKAEQGLPGIRTFASLDELGAETEVDFVDVCTPPALHAGAVLNAIAHDWHVICEKPLFLHSHEFESVRKQARAANRCVFPVHNWRYAPMIKRATEALRAGVIGPLHELEIETLRLRDCEVSDPDRPNWRRDRAISGGGILMDHGWHAIYLALGWFGESPIECHALLHYTGGSAVEDEAVLKIRFPSGNATISLTWNADERRNILRLVGERGRIVLDNDKFQIGSELTRFEHSLSQGSYHPEWFEAMLPDVISSFDDPSRANRIFEEAATCLSLIERAYATHAGRLTSSAV